MSAIAAPAIVSAVLTGLDGLFTSDEEREAAKLKAMAALQAPNMAQIDVNKIEAASAGNFKGGWRPAIGWVGAFGLGYNFILQPLMVWALLIFKPETPTPPPLDIEQLVGLIFAMLGLGGLRSFDLAKGTRK